MVGIWCLTNQFYWWRKPEDPEKTIDLLHVTEKLYHKVVLLAPSRSRTHNISGDRLQLHKYNVVENPITIRSRPRRPAH